MFDALGVIGSAMHVHQTWMDAISDNIANSQTVGYKKVDTRFSDLITISNKSLNLPGGEYVFGPCSSHVSPSYRQPAAVEAAAARPRRLCAPGFPAGRAAVPPARYRLRKNPGSG